MDGSEDQMIVFEDGKSNFDMKNVLTLKQWVKNPPIRECLSDSESDVDSDDDPIVIPSKRSKASQESQQRTQGKTFTTTENSKEVSSYEPKNSKASNLFQTSQTDTPANSQTHSEAIPFSWHSTFTNTSQHGQVFFNTSFNTSSQFSICLSFYSKTSSIASWSETSSKAITVTIETLKTIQSNERPNSIETPKVCLELLFGPQEFPVFEIVTQLLKFLSVLFVIPVVSSW